MFTLVNTFDYQTQVKTHGVDESSHVIVRWFQRRVHPQ